MAGANTSVSLPFRLAYTLTDGQFRNAFDSAYEPWGLVQVGDELPYVPRHQFHASMDVEQGPWRVRVDATYTGRMRTVAGQRAFDPARATDAVGVLGLSGEYAVTGEASLYASIQNLTGAAYVVSRHPAGARPGLSRLATVGLRLDLSR